MARFALLALLAAFVSAACSLEAGGGGTPPADNDTTDTDDSTVALNCDVHSNPPPVVTTGAAAPTNTTWTPEDGRTPRFVHMSWDDDPATTVALQWQTDDPTPDGYTPRAWITRADVYAANGNKMLYKPEWVIEGDFLAYTARVNRQDVPHIQFTAHVKGLIPGQTYYYRVGSWDSWDEAAKAFVNPHLSEEGTFTTGVLKGCREKFTFVAAGDSRGGFDGITSKINELAAVPADFWLFNGDMTNLGAQGEWYLWFTAMAPLLKGKVLQPIQGNHEVVVELYYNQFALPRMGGALPEDIQEFAWSVDYGNVHIIGMNSNTEQIVQRQLPWLEADLQKAAADRAAGRIDWIVTMWHHPTYSCGSTHGSTDWIVRNVVPLLEQYNVDLTFAGHDHIYERTKPLRNGREVASGGTTHIVAGSFFSPPYQVLATCSDHDPAVTRSGNGGNYVMIDVDGKTLRGTAKNMAGEVIDSFTITRP